VRLHLRPRVYQGVADDEAVEAEGVDEGARGGWGGQKRRHQRLPCIVQLVHQEVAQGWDVLACDTSTRRNQGAHVTGLQPGPPRKEGQ